MEKRRVQLRDVLVSTLGLLLLLGLLSAADERVRAQVAAMANGTPSTAEFATVSRQARAIGGTVATAVKDQSIEHAPLVIFSVTATVLMLFMLRT